MHDIIGQPHAIATLQSTLNAQRVPHAWLFHGPNGVGKKTTALAFATILLDPSATNDLAGHLSADPDGSTARQISEGSHPDLHLITKELAAYSSDLKVRTSKQASISIDVVNEFILKPAFRSGHGTNKALASKVFIIDEAELLAADGQNRLLKTLEEPPVGTTIILISTNADRLLPTIRSRCRPVAFRSLGNLEMQQWIKRQSLETAPSQLEFLLRFADGSPGQMQLAQEHNLFAWYELLAPMIQAMNNGQFPEQIGVTMAALVDDLAQTEVKKRKEASKLVANRLAASFLFTMLAAEVRRDIHRAVNDHRTIDPYSEILERLVQAQSQIASNANIKLVLENVAVQWTDIAQRYAGVC